MNSDAAGKVAAGEFAKAAALALGRFEDLPDAAPVLTRLPHPFSNMSRAEWARSIELWKQHGAPLLKSLPARACPACGSDASDYIFDSYDAYPYHECVKCRTWFVPLVVTHELFERYFELVPEARRYGDYTDAQAVDAAAIDADRARFEGYYASLKACFGLEAPEPLGTLDVGCGVANSLAIAAELGFAAEGVEVNRHAVALARKLGRRVHFPDEDTDAKAFDVVTLWETLEHIADPLSALSVARTRLKPGGLLAITVPNLNAPDIRSMRGDSLQIHGGPAWPGHINLWTPETLGRLLRTAGFETLHVAGQFSSNLEELIAYHFGHWSGARDYLRVDQPEFALPAAAKHLVAAIGAAAGDWQEAFATAPIMFVLARRSDGNAPAGLADHLRAQTERRRARIAATYGLEAAPGRLPVRGTAMDLNAPDWCAEGVTYAGNRLRIDAGGAAPFGYLWRSQSLELPAGTVVRIRGVLLKGGLSAGLIAEERWAAQKACQSSGQFELSLEVPAGKPVQLVICNNDSGSGGAIADVDVVEIVEAPV